MNSHVIILFKSEYSKEARIIKALATKKCEDILLWKLEEGYIPYARGAELFYGENESGTFKTVIFVHPLFYDDSPIIFQKLQSIENMPGEIIWVSVPDRRIKNKKFYGILQKIYMKSYRCPVADMKKKAEIYKKSLGDSSSFRLKTKSGTDLVFSRATDILEDIIDGENDRENNGVFQIPSGEVFFAIKEGSANGVIVIFGKKYDVINNHVVTEDYGEIVICEFGMGINSFLPPTDKLDISEKAYKTCHLGFGDNTSFGGNIKEGYHFDIVFEKFSLYSGTKCLVDFGEEKKNVALL